MERIRPGVGDGDPGEQATLSQMERAIPAPKKTKPKASTKPKAQAKKAPARKPTKAPARKAGAAKTGATKTKPSAAKTRNKKAFAAKPRKAAQLKATRPKAAPKKATPPKAPAVRKAPPKAAKPKASAPLLKLALQSLDDDQAVDVATIDLEGKTSIADHMIVASGRSQRQVGAMAVHLMQRLKAAGYRGIQIEGMPQNDWVLVDAGDVIVHLFRPEVRTFYNLEKMWSVEFNEAAAEAEQALA